MHVASQVAHSVVEEAPAEALGGKASAPVGADHVLTLLWDGLAHAAGLGAQAPHHTGELLAASHALPASTLQSTSRVSATCKPTREEEEERRRREVNVFADTMSSTIHL